MHPAGIYNNDKYTLIFQKHSSLFITFIYLPQRTDTVCILNNFSDSTGEETVEITAMKLAICLLNKLFNLIGQIYSNFKII